MLLRRQRGALVHEPVSCWEYDECYAKRLEEKLNAKDVHEGYIRYVLLFNGCSSSPPVTPVKLHATRASQHASSTDIGQQKELSSHVKTKYFTLQNKT